MGLGQLLHQASGDGLVGGGPDAAVIAQRGLSSQPPQQQPPASLSSCFPNVLLGGSRIRGSAQTQSSVVQHWSLIPPLFLLLPHKIQRDCGLPPASTGGDLPNTRKIPALLSTLWALAQLNHHFHTIKPKHSKHTIKKPFYNPMYTHTVDTSTPFALFFPFFEFKNTPVQRDTSLANIFFPYQF